MRRLTTPTHTFKLPFLTSGIDKIKITYAQGNTPIVEKTKEDCQLEDYKISVTLTQEDTKKFDSNNDVQIQLRIKTTSGDVLASQIINEYCAAVLDDEVL